jgi:hypothetical protein
VVSRSSTGVGIIAPSNDAILDGTVSEGLEGGGSC